MRNAASKNEFSKQFDTIVRGVEESLKRQENTAQQKQAVLEQHKQIYQTVRLLSSPFNELILILILISCFRLVGG